MRHSNDSALVSLFVLCFSVFWFLFCVSLMLVKVWLVLSLGTSVVKAVNEDCGKEYSIEGVVRGNWFCED